MRKTNRILLSVLLAALLCSCVPSKNWMVPETETVGGYTLSTKTLECTVIADGTHKYSRFHSNTDGRTVELYASTTELVLIQSVDGTKYYYRERFNDQDQFFENPLKGVFKRLGELEFAFYKQSDGYNMYEAVQTERFVDAQQISYRVSLLSITWTDGKDYVFRYYEYADGAVLISAEAPDEINPLLCQDTPWRVDLTAQCVRNSQTGQAVSLTVISQEVGEGLSPRGETSVTERQINIYAYVSSDKNQLEQLQYQDGAKVTLLYTADIAEPEITPDMIPMDGEMLQLAVMLISSIEALI